MSEMYNTIWLIPKTQSKNNDTSIFKKITEFMCANSIVHMRVINQS